MNESWELAEEFWRVEEMNERIRQLFEQAHIQPSAERIGQFAWIRPKTFSPEKFAELIVAECGVALSPMLRDQISRGKAFDLIKQHFGVKE